jgi:transcriptional regulator with XRE-family HTH domain
MLSSALATLKPRTPSEADVDIKRAIVRRGTGEARTMKLSDLRTSEHVLDDELLDPAFRAEWERTSVARALALQVLAYRTKNELSQRALAAMIGMSQPQVARLEAGSHNPTIETLSRVADVLGTEIDLRIPTRRREPQLTTRRKPTPARRSPVHETATDDKARLRRTAAG